MAELNTRALHTPHNRLTGPESNDENRARIAACSTDIQRSGIGYVCQFQNRQDQAQYSGRGEHPDKLCDLRRIRLQLESGGEVEYQDLGNFGAGGAYTQNIGAMLLYPGDESVSLYVKLSYATTLWKIMGQRQRNTAFTQEWAFSTTPRQNWPTDSVGIAS